MNDKWTIDEDAIFAVLERVKAKFAMKPKVAFAGFGNCGKSSLFNCIYGAKVASVSMKTDETTPENMSRRERFGIDFTDTPGFGTEKSSLGQVEKLLANQHVVVHVLNGTAAISSEDQRFHKFLKDGRASSLTVVNKLDLLDETEKADVIGSVKEKLALGPDQFLFVSAKRATNVAELVKRITVLLPFAMQDPFIGQQQVDSGIKERRVQTIIYSKATLAAAIGAIPIPFADIALLTPLQIGMVASIGYLHGVEVSKARIGELIAVVGAGIGFRQLAVQLFKWVPGWGSMIGAAVAFAGTMALGKTANAWFKSEMKMSTDDFREVYKQAASRAKAEYEAKPTSSGSQEAEKLVAALRKKAKDGELSAQGLAEAFANIDIG